MVIILDEKSEINATTICHPYANNLHIYIYIYKMFLSGVCVHVSHLSSTAMGPEI
ncbi:MAG: hypothetical protein ACKPKO_48145 [Candidatus Fonsibacter sp.]